jgi:hypothetical protein
MIFLSSKAPEMEASSRAHALSMIENKGGERRQLQSASKFSAGDSRWPAASPKRILYQGQSPLTQPKGVI